MRDWTLMSETRQNCTAPLQEPGTQVFSSRRPASDAAGRTPTAGIRKRAVAEGVCGLIPGFVDDICPIAE